MTGVERQPQGAELMNCTMHFPLSPINMGEDDWTFTTNSPVLSSPHTIFFNSNYRDRLEWAVACVFHVTARQREHIF